MLAEIATLVSHADSINLASTLSALCMLLTGVAAVVASTKKVRVPSHRRMTLKQWAEIPDAPVQRNTEERAKTLKVRKRLSKLKSVHTNVVMARLPDKSCYKVDAHTRTWMWLNGMTDQVPAEVDVTIHDVDDIDGVLDLYYSLDDAGQVKTASDQLYSAFKQFEVPITSKFFQRGVGIISALKEAYREICRAYNGDDDVDAERNASVAQIVEFFKPQLTALDAIDPKTCQKGPNFKGPVTTAFLLAHYKYSELGQNLDEVVAFFAAYNNDLGRKNGRFYDPIYSVTKTMAGSGAGEQLRMSRASKILGAVERWLEPRGRDVKYTRESAVDMAHYLVDKNARKTSRSQRSRFAKERKNITR